MTTTNQAGVKMTIGSLAEEIYHYDCTSEDGKKSKEPIVEVKVHEDVKRFCAETNRVQVLCSCNYRPRCQVHNFATDTSVMDMETMETLCGDDCCGEYQSEHGLDTKPTKLEAKHEPTIPSIHLEWLRNFVSIEFSTSVSVRNTFLSFVLRRVAVQLGKMASEPEVEMAKLNNYMTGILLPMNMKPLLNPLLRIEDLRNHLKLRHEPWPQTAEPVLPVIATKHRMFLYLFYLSPDRPQTKKEYKKTVEAFRTTPIEKLCASHLLYKNKSPIAVLPFTLVVPLDRLQKYFQLVRENAEKKLKGEPEVPLETIDTSKVVTETTTTGE